jgi:hypothetical protein
MDAQLAAYEQTKARFAKQLSEKAVPLLMPSFSLPASSGARPRCLSRDLVAFALFCWSNRHRVRNFGV